MATTIETAPRTAIVPLAAQHVESSLWYKDAIIYQVHVRAFRDSNSDGIGDFPRPHRTTRLHSGSGRHGHLVAAVLPIAAQG